MLHDESAADLDVVAERPRAALARMAYRGLTITRRERRVPDRAYADSGSTTGVEPLSEALWFCGPQTIAAIGSGALISLVGLSVRTSRTP